MAVEPIDLISRGGVASGLAVEVEMPLDSLQEGLTARFGAVDMTHVRCLVEVADRWPPILVQRSTRQVIDGVHRLYAARALGRDRLACVFFDGDAAEALIEAVRRNVKHGRPLTLRERKAAADRILRMRSFWSDRLIADTVGLSATTIGSLRQKQRLLDGAPTSQFRFGRDGKFRPHDPIELRRKIMHEIEANPTASLRAIAAATGGSPETVRSVRKEMWSRESPSIAREGSNEDYAAGPSNAEDSLGGDPWASDTAMQSTEAGRTFIAWFSRTDVDDEWLSYVRELPLSRIYAVADEARRRAREWIKIADAVENRARQGQHVCV